MLPLTNRRLAIILAPRSLWTIDPADYKDVRLPGLNSSSKKLCRFYKIKGISASFWGLSDFSGQVSQFCVNITPIELKSVTEW